MKISKTAKVEITWKSCWCWKKRNFFLFHNFFTSSSTTTRTTTSLKKNKLKRTKTNNSEEKITCDKALRGENFSNFSFCLLLQTRINLFEKIFSFSLVSCQVNGRNGERWRLEIMKKLKYISTKGFLFLFSSHF